MCPFGPAWFDEPRLANTAHAPAECSNAGLCDRKTGMCECQPGFEGGACELTSCPVDTFGTTCGGHGQCVTMRELAQFATENGDAAPVMYGSSQANATAWDADHIQGCLCDEPGYIGSTQHNRTGYFGYDCSSHQCPVGDYLRTTNQSFEEQAFWCNASSGNFTLSFRRQTTSAIRYDATSEELEAALEALSSIGSVSVLPEGSSICTSHEKSPFIVRFLSELGDLPLLNATASHLKGGNITIFETVPGTKENTPCSQQGLCDLGTGKCSCFADFYSSNGNGEFGTRNDCGLLEIHGCGSQCDY